MSVKGLKPSTQQGFSIHTFSAPLSDATKTAIGSIFNPDDDPHGCLTSNQRRAGDLGNLQTNAQGAADTRIVNRMVQLTGEWSVMGRGLLIWDRKDDCKLGNAALTYKPFGYCTIAAKNPRAP